MKKLLKVTALLLVAAAMFAGCKNNDDDSTGGALFSKEDVTEVITYNEITFSEGSWVASYSKNGTADDGSTMIDSKTAEFTVAADGSVEFTKMVEYGRTEGKLPADATPEEIAAAKLMGYTISGDKYYFEFTEEADAEQLANMSIYNIKSMMDDFETIKTNEDKSKYFGEATYTQNSSKGGAAQITMSGYIMKK